MQKADTGQPFCLKMKIEPHKPDALGADWMTVAKERISHKSSKSTLPALGIRTRLDAQVRSKMIVEAAFQAIAKGGFEGLRTREIAKLVGINSATLHHYLTTKEDLIAAIADYLQSRFRTEDTQRVEGESAVTALEHQLKDAIFYYRRRPDMLAVYREFVGRAPRDPAIRKLVRRLHESWHAQVIETLFRGISDGTFRTDLDPKAAAGVIISTVWGLISQVFYSIDGFEAAFRELLKWIVRDPITKKLKSQPAKGEANNLRRLSPCEGPDEVS
jgi:AcrR family transcriptional regulator